MNVLQFRIGRAQVYGPNTKTYVVDMDWIITVLNFIKLTIELEPNQTWLFSNQLQPWIQNGHHKNSVCTNMKKFIFCNIYIFLTVMLETKRYMLVLILASACLQLYKDTDRSVSCLSVSSLKQVNVILMFKNIVNSLDPANTPSNSTSQLDPNFSNCDHTLYHACYNCTFSLYLNR